MVEEPFSTDYELDHESLYRELIDGMDESTRRLWIDFIEDTASHALRACPPVAVGEPFPRFAELHRKIDPPEKRSSGSDPVDWYVLAFSFGASFPFCSLAFRHVRRSAESLRRLRARFACLFPPEDPPESESINGYALLVDEGGRSAGDCGLRMELQPRFQALTERIPWFLPGFGATATPRVTLPGTVILDARGILRFLDIPSDVTNRLPPDRLRDLLDSLPSPSPPDESSF